MRSVWDEVSLGNLKLKNRIIRSATLEGITTDGHINPAYGDIYEELAVGGVGLIITGMMAVSEVGALSNTMVNVQSANFVQSLTEIVDRVHGLGCKLMIQLNHCGMKSCVFLPRPAVGPMQIGENVKKLDIEGIQKIIDDFANAAMMCKQSGADGIQIHAAHGFLVNQFLSPHYNKRGDEYGKTTTNRCRLLVDICRKVRKKVGDTYPVFLKLNQDDLVDNGIDISECRGICEVLKSEKIDAIEISCGVMEGRESMAFKPASEQEYNVSGASVIASECGKPVIAVGGIRSAVHMNRILNETDIEAFSMCRPFIKEPDIVNKWKVDNNYKAKCSSCGACFGVGRLKCKVS